MNVVTDHVTDTASVAKKGNHTLDGNKLQVTLGTESDEEDSPRQHKACLLYTSPSPRDMYKSRMPSSA